LKKKDSGKKVIPGKVVLEAKGITKRFPGLVANDHIDFEIRAGEIHALLGENGAGKSTLMNVLYGLYRPDEGELYSDGKKVVFNSPNDAIKHGIGMVHQHFMLIPTLTVAENIALGASGVLSRLDEVERKISAISKESGLNVDPKAKVWQLSVGEKQRVEIVKALYRGVKVLIMDEPTAVLTPPEVKEIMAIIRSMADKGLAVIPFITHKLPEVMAISDSVTVLRQGKVVARIKTKETCEKDLAKSMVGREVVLRIKRVEAKKAGVFLEVKDLCALNDKGLPALKNVSFSIEQGEIFGIAGVSGNGQRELAEVIVGLRKSTRGKVMIGNKDLTNCSTAKILDSGLGHIPEDRSKGVVGELSIAENLALELYAKEPFAYKWFLPWKNRIFINQDEVSKYADRLIAEYNIMPPNKNIKAGTLSGGNAQRIILARVLSRKPKVLISNQPTRGLDVGSTEFIRNKLIEQKRANSAVLLISEDLDEIMQLSDRIAVMYGGEIVGILPGHKAKIDGIGLLMAGSKDKSGASCRRR